jgi:MFS family permease
VEQPEQPVPSRRLPRNVQVVTVTSFLTDISSEMIFNLLPLYLTNVVGARTGVVGLIEGLAESTASLLKVYSGWLSDRIRKRKRLAVLGYSISAIAKPFLYFAVSWWSVLGVRVADRVGKGVRTAPRDALIADSIDHKNRGKAFGIHRAGDTAGALVGLLIALGVVWLSQGDSLSLSRDTFQWVVLVSILPAALAVLVLASGAKDPPSTAAASGAPPRIGLGLKTLDPLFRRFLLVVMLFTLGNSADAFLILRSQERGLGVPAVLGLLVVFTLVYATVSGPFGILSDRIGRRRIILGGWLAYAGIYLGFALTNQTWQIWGLYALYGLYYGATEGVVKAYVADIVTGDQRGLAYGLYNAAVGIVAFPASLLAGILWQGIGPWSGFGASAPFVFGAGLALTATGLFVFWVVSPSPPSPGLRAR